VTSAAISFVKILDVSIGTQKWGSTHPTEHLSPLCIPIPEEAPISFSEKETVNPYHPDLGIFNRAQPFPPGASAIESVSASFHLEKWDFCASIQNETYGRRQSYLPPPVADVSTIGGARTSQNPTA
jgi:hypothetical protein